MSINDEMFDNGIDILINLRMVSEIEEETNSLDPIIERTELLLPFFFL